MKRNLLLLLICFTTLNLFAQRPPGPPPNGERPSAERIRAMKVGMISNELKLTEEQAKTFWPVYNRYEDDKRTLNSSLRKKIQKVRKKNLSAEEELAIQDEVFELRQKELELVKKYRPEFLEIISASQYSSLLLAEREFNQMLLRELHQRKNNRPPNN